MKRWSVLLLLLLLPLTMAPRTSLTDDPSELDLHAVVSRTDVKAGTAVNLVLQARNVSDSVIARATVDIAVIWDGKSDSLRVRSSRTCDVTSTGLQLVYSCRLGSLAPGQLRTTQVTARPLEPGTLIFDVVGQGVLSPVPADEPITVEVRG